MGFEKGNKHGKGRPKRVDLIAVEARKHPEKIFAVLLKQLESKDERIAQRAAEILSDRGWGKPQEYLEIEADNNHSGEVGVRGLPNLMGAISSDIQRRRAKPDLQASGENEPVLPVEVPAQSS